MILKLKFQPLYEDSVLPQRIHPTDAGYDLTCHDIELDDADVYTYHSGVAVEIPAGHVGLLFPRSSIYKTGLALTNSVGVIDSGYRGEIMAKFNLALTTTHFAPYKVGERFAQLVIVPVLTLEPVFVDYLTASDRGEGGYGSTGK